MNIFLVHCDPKDNDWGCCSEDTPCGLESGDCDSDFDCAGDLICQSDVGNDFGAYHSMDVCLVTIINETKILRTHT